MMVISVQNLETNGITTGLNSMFTKLIWRVVISRDFFGKFFSRKQSCHFDFPSFLVLPVFSPTKILTWAAKTKRSSSRQIADNFYFRACSRHCFTVFRNLFATIFDSLPIGEFFRGSKTSKISTFFDFWVVSGLVLSSFLREGPTLAICWPLAL